MNFDVGLILPVHGIAFADTLAAAHAAEQASLAAVWVPDHLLNVARPTAGVLACEVVLAAVAATTARVRVGTLVLSTPFRHPAMLAKQVASIEALAPGRLVLGLGAGGMTYKETVRQLGFPSLTVPERVAHVEETVACLRKLLHDDPADFRGRFVQTRDLRIHPRPRASIPIVLAARARRMLELTARVADGWNCPLPHEFAEGLAALERLGRERDSIEASAFAICVIGENQAAARRALERAGPGAQLFGDVARHHVYGDPEQAAERIAALRAQGAQHVALDVRGLPAPEALALLAQDVLPRIA